MITLSHLLRTRFRGSGHLFRNPQNQRIETSLYPQFRDTKSASDRVKQLWAEHGRQGLQIDADTAVTSWAGEVMDEAMAIEGLLHSDGVVGDGFAQSADNPAITPYNPRRVITGMAA